ncbi:MAG: ABC transporter ATP-binding protein [Saprospiraceae bacterium]|nr:ABC transporter ATP-binding protein [Saprospiraceae bacterium]
MIKVENLYKKYGRSAVLQGVSVNFDQPGITAVLGPNGSGKTTLLKCILGLVIPDQGSIYFNGQNIASRHRYRRHLSQVSQTVNFPENLSAHELILMAKDIRPDTTREKELIELFELGGELNKKMRHLSGGNRQKINLLLGLMYDSPLIILDEPSNGLDPLSYLNLKNFLNREASRGKQILVTTHLVSFIEELADRIVFILEGKIYFDGSPFDLISYQKQQKLEEAIASILRPQNQMSHVQNI